MDNIEFSIDDLTYTSILKIKSELGFEEKSWNEWFQYISNKLIPTKNNNIENVATEFFIKNDFELWVKNFAVNLDYIWKEKSAKNLDNIFENTDETKKNSAIVIGRGPSLIKNDHLKLLAESSFNGIIICTDGVLKKALETGVTPEKFQKFYVVTIDAYKEIKDLYDNEIVSKYGKQIKGIFSTFSHPDAVEKARSSGISIHWIHPLFDYQEGRKSFNNIAGLMVKVKHPNGLPAIQTGGNTGTSSWFVAWRILKCKTVCLIGIDHGWTTKDSLERIISHGFAFEPPNIKQDDPNFEKLFPKIFNPEFKTFCILDPIFQYYSNALKEFISRSPEDVLTINATEGGSIFGNRVICKQFQDFLECFKN